MNRLMLMLGTNALLSLYSKKHFQGLEPQNSLKSRKSMSRGIRNLAIVSNHDRRIKFADDPTTLELKKVNFWWIFGESRCFLELCVTFLRFRASRSSKTASKSGKSNGWGEKPKMLSEIWRLFKFQRLTAPGHGEIPN